MQLSVPKAAVGRYVTLSTAPLIHHTFKASGRRTPAHKATLPAALTTLLPDAGTVQHQTLSTSWHERTKESLCARYSGIAKGTFPYELNGYGDYKGPRSNFEYLEKRDREPRRDRHLLSGFEMEGLSVRGRSLGSIIQQYGINQCL